MIAKLMPIHTAVRPCGVQAYDGDAFAILFVIGAVSFTLTGNVDVPAYNRIVLVHCSLSLHFTHEG